jgi:hypothetical protein
MGGESIFDNLSDAQITALADVFKHDRPRLIEFMRAKGLTDDEMVRRLVLGRSRDDRHALAESFAHLLRGSEGRPMTIARFKKIAAART